MKKILLLRHAKSDRENHSGPDFERYLNQRGRSDAPKVAAALEEKNMVPALIIASPAVRVEETLSLMTDVWKNPPEIQWDKSLYLCSPRRIFQLIEEQDELRDFTGFAGHNPCMEEVYAALSEDGAAFPTYAAAVISFACESWLTVQKAPGKVELFITPREL